MLFYSQRDPKWASHPLGWGPRLGTIGAFGCYDTVCAMIANDAGLPCNPVGFDVLATAKRIFVRDPTGTFDFLPDNALDLVFRDRFRTIAYNGFRKDLIAAAIPTKDTYAYVHISTAAVPTHYVLMLGTDAIADPWYGKRGSLAGYGGPGAVVKTYIVRALPPPVDVKPPAPPVVVAPPVVTPPEPIPVEIPPSPNPVPPAPVPLPTPPPVATTGAGCLGALLFGL